MRAPVALMLVALVALGPLGCAHKRSEPVAALLEKPATGTVALVVSPSVVYTRFQRPAVVGAGQGAKEGASVGAVVPLVPGMFVIKTSVPDIRALFVGVAMLGAGLVLAPVGAGVGAAVGTVAAPPRDEVEQTAAMLEQALAEANLPEMLTALILEGAGERPVVSGRAPESVVADTVLEVGSVGVYLVSKDATDWRPGLRLRLSVSGRLVRASDGEELRSWVWEHEGAKASFLEWGRDDARRFRAELARGAQALTAKIIDDVF
jgi:hypothetical protein